MRAWENTTTTNNRVITSVAVDSRCGNTGSRIVHDAVILAALVNWNWQG